MDGLEATRTIKAEQPSVSVLVITTYDNPDYLLEAIKAGAAGYILKDASNRQLRNAIWRALEGDDTHDAPDDLAHCSPRFAARL